MITYRTIKVHLPGNNYYPRLYIIRDGIKREYSVNETRFKWLQNFLDRWHGRIYVDLENSNIEVCMPKEDGS
jgi:hypothetical protein